MLLRELFSALKFQSGSLMNTMGSILNVSIFSRKSEFRRISIRCQVVINDPLDSSPPSKHRRASFIVFQCSTQYLAPPNILTRRKVNVPRFFSHVFDL